MMYHHNTVTRTSYYEHDVQCEGIDHCYDCSAEIFILKQYLNKMSGTKKDNINRDVSMMSLNISEYISTKGRTLCMKFEL